MKRQGFSLFKSVIDAKVKAEGHAIFGFFVYQIVFLQLVLHAAALWINMDILPMIRNGSVL